MHPQIPPPRYEKTSPYPEQYLEYGEDTFYGEEPSLRHLGWLLLLSILLVIALGAFCLFVPDKWLAAEHMDQAATAMPFDPPRIEIQTALKGVPLPSTNVQKTLQQRRAFFNDSKPCSTRSKPWATIPLFRDWKIPRWRGWMPADNGCRRCRIPTWRTGYVLRSGMTVPGKRAVKSA